MIYIYRRRKSTGARDLRDGILMQGTLARRTQGEQLRNLRDGDAVVCWGDNFAAPVVVNVKTLNNVAPLSKFAEARRLAEKGVPTIQVSQQRPRVAEARQPFVEEVFRIDAAAFRPADAQVMAGRLNEFVAQQARRRQAWERQPAVPAEIWLPRRNNHVGGNDLLGELPDPNFYSKKENIVEEYRLHMFQGKSMRAGKKVQRPQRPNGGVPHPWIRSFDAGWVIQYDNFKSTKDMRKIAAAAVKALDLDFGAVDLGKKADGTYIVLEVNRAPGVEGGTVTNYAKSIIAWANGQEAQEERD